MFQRWYPNCRRSFGQARVGYEQPDIIGGAIEDDFFIEVKLVSKAKFRPKEWWPKLISDQVKYQKLNNDDSMGAPPIIVYRITGTKPVEWMVMCYLSDFACLKQYSTKPGSVMAVPWGHFAKMLNEL